MKLELSGSRIQVTIFFGPEVLPLLVLSPFVAHILADAKYTKNDIRQYLYDKAYIPANEIEEQLMNGLRPGFTIQRAIEEGMLPASYGISKNSGRTVPLLRFPKQLQIVVAGPSTRNRNFIASQVGNQGLMISKVIKLPSNSNTLIRSR